MKKDLISPIIFPIMGSILAFCILGLTMSKYSNGENNMSNELLGGIVALSVAIVGAASGIWMQVIQFKKDAKRIDDVKSSVGDVKSDTSEIKPQVKNTDENVKKIRDEVVEKIVPNIGKLTGVDALVEELNYQKRIKSETTASIPNPDYFINSINKLYETNAMLSEKMKSTELENQKLKVENAQLKGSNILMQGELNRYREDQENEYER